MTRPAGFYVKFKVSLHAPEIYEKISSGVSEIPNNAPETSEEIISNYQESPGTSETLDNAPTINLGGPGSVSSELSINSQNTSIPDSDLEKWDSTLSGVSSEALFGDQSERQSLDQPCDTSLLDEQEARSDITYGSEKMGNTTEHETFQNFPELEYGDSIVEETESQRGYGSRYDLRDEIKGPDRLQIVELSDGSPKSEKNPKFEKNHKDRSSEKWKWKISNWFKWRKK